MLVSAKADASPRIAGSQSVYRAIAILRCVARHNNHGITAKQLSKELGLTPQTAHRLLQVFVDEGLLTVDPFSKEYHLGLEMYQMGSAAHDFTIADHLEGALQSLRDQTGETVFLFIRSGADSLCLRRVDGDFPIRALTLTSGSRRPLGIGAGGLVLLASLPDVLRGKIIQTNLKKFRSYFETSAALMEADVSQTQAAGMSFNDGRLKERVRAIGMAAGPASNPGLCAISIATSDKRMEAEYRGKIEAVLRSEIEDLNWDLWETDGYKIGGRK